MAANSILHSERVGRFAAPHRRAGSRLYAWMALAAALIIFAGFARTFYLRSSFGAPPLSALLVVHGIVMTGWFVLFFVQVWLVGVGRTDLHRRVGVVGMIVAVLVLCVGVAAAIDAGRRGVSPPSGIVTPLTSVDVKPQLSSMVAKVHIQDGQFVKAGDLLITLDSRTDEANVAKARAQLAKDNAALADAQRQLARAQQLLAQKFISQGALDTAQALVDAQSAAVLADQAAIDAARVALSYARITAPVAGRAGAVSVSAGSAVQANLSTLVTITQLDPIAVAFSLPQRNLPDALAALGVSLAIDDFGTGYSSLAYLKKFPISKLKIDRAFVMGLPADEGDRAIVGATIAMAQALKLSVVAEGVETDAQRDFLQGLHCEAFQGFLCSPGLAAEDFDKLYATLPKS